MVTTQEMDLESALGTLRKRMYLMMNQKKLVVGVCLRQAAWRKSGVKSETARLCQGSR